LGMLEYAKEQEEKLLKAAITDLKPRVAAQMLPGMPAYVLFMLIRHLDHINDDKNVRSLIQTGISHIKKTIKKRGQSDLELKTQRRQEREEPHPNGDQPHQEDDQEAGSK